jgi:hypothetical protein
MHAAPRVKQWMHLLHDESVRIAHFTEHLVHEKAFWAFLGIVTVMALLFSLLLLLGDENAIDYRAYPFPLP